MAKKRGFGACLKWFSSETVCQEYPASLRWQAGYVCPQCGCRHGYRLSNRRYQCAQCRHQTSVTAGIVLHKTHMPLMQWFLAFYSACQDKRGISAVQLAAMLGTTYRTAWYVLRRVRTAMGQRDESRRPCGVIEFDDAHFGGPTTGKSGVGTEKAKVFVALSLNERGNPRFLKIQVTPNIRQASVKKFVRAAFAYDSVICSDGYRCDIPALEGYTHEHRSYDPDSGLLHWLHIVISNAKAFILGTYHGLPKKYLQSYLDEYSFRFSRCDFAPALFKRLTLAVSLSRLAD